MARNLTAQPRSLIGKNNNNRLRVKGLLPGVLYSHGKSDLIQINKKEFSSLFGSKISESVIIDLDLQGKEKCHVFVKDYQVDPVTDQIIHVDFYKITEGEKIKTMVPLETKGTAIGARLGGVFEMIDRELSVECLPSELPEKIVLDISELNIGQGIHVKDIKGPASMKILLDPEHIVAHVTTVKEEQPQVAEATVESVVEGEAEKGEKSEKGDKDKEKEKSKD